MKYYVGVAMSASSTVDTGLAIIDADNNIITLDKLFTMQDIEHFFNNFPSKKHSSICVTLPWDNTMLNGKWRILSKPYQMVATNDSLHNLNNWTDRYSTRGCELFKSIKEYNQNIYRCELYLARQNLHLNSCFKERSPADCKFLQMTLKNEHGFTSLPANMLPMSQLEAIVAALLAKGITMNPDNFQILYKFNSIDVINKKL